MRSVHVILLCVLLVVVGLVCAFGRRLTFRVAPAPATTQSTSAALPPPPPPPPGPDLETASQKASYRRAFERSASSVPATAGLACIQDALGGVQVFAGVSSLRIVASTKVTATTEMRPAANKREISVVFPDRYRRSDVQTDAAPGVGNEFVRQMLMRLPRELAGVRLLQRTTLDSGQERLAIDASGLDGLDATLLADARTCTPVALEYRQASTTKAGSSDTYRVELSEFRRFGGILFPTVLRTAKNGGPWEEEYDSEIQVNAPLGAEYFRNVRRPGL